MYFYFWQINDDDNEVALVFFVRTAYVCISE